MLANRFGDTTPRGKSDPTPFSARLNFRLYRFTQVRYGEPLNSRWNVRALPSRLNPAHQSLPRFKKPLGEHLAGHRDGDLVLQPGARTNRHLRTDRAAISE